MEGIGTRGIGAEHHVVPQIAGKEQTAALRAALPMLTTVAVAFKALVQGEVTLRQAANWVVGGMTLAVAITVLMAQTWNALTERFPDLTKASPAASAAALYLLGNESKGAKVEAWGEGAFGVQPSPEGPVYRVGSDGSIVELDSQFLALTEKFTALKEASSDAMVSISARLEGAKEPSVERWPSGAFAVKASPEGNAYRVGGDGPVFALDSKLLGLIEQAPALKGATMEALAQVRELTEEGKEIFAQANEDGSVDLYLPDGSGLQVGADAVVRDFKTALVERFPALVDAAPEVQAAVRGLLKGGEKARLEPLLKGMTGNFAGPVGIAVSRNEWVDAHTGQRRESFAVDLSAQVRVKGNPIPQELARRYDVLLEGGKWIVRESELDQLRPAKIATTATGFEGRQIDMRGGDWGIDEYIAGDEPKLMEVKSESGKAYEVYKQLEKDLPRDAAITFVELPNGEFASVKDLGGEDYQAEGFTAFVTALEKLNPEASKEQIELAAGFCTQTFHASLMVEGEAGLRETVGDAFGEGMLSLRRMTAGHEGRYQAEEGKVFSGHSYVVRKKGQGFEVTVQMPFKAGLQDFADESPNARHLGYALGQLAIDTNTGTANLSLGDLETLPKPVQL